MGRWFTCRHGTTTKWGTPRAAWTCWPISESGGDEEEPARFAAAGARRQTRAGARRFQRPDQERKGHGRHAAARLAADDQVPAGQRRARRSALAPRPPQGRPGSAILTETDRARP